MENSKTNYLLAIIFHIVLGISVYFVMFLSKVYALLIIIVGLHYIIKNKNRNNEVLYVCGYLTGIEVFLRMTQGNLLYEYGKYSVIFFVIVGMFYRGFARNAISYWIFLLLLVPGVAIALVDLNFDDSLRKSVAFNISGPVCLALTSLYTYQRKITFDQINKILLFVGLPIISCVTYLFLYSPNIRDIVTGTASNFETSGGFGPNQVATILGLGMFIFLSRLMFKSPSVFYIVVNLLIAVVISYRGVVTFSRGGVITGVLMVAALAFFTYIKINSHGKAKLNIITVFMALMFVGVWSYSSLTTSGLIEKRYANQDVAGREKASKLSGREHIMASEIDYFLENPVFGVGVAMGAEKRGEETGREVMSHNELTRLLGEHGSLGIVALVILFFTPIILYFDNRNHIYLICFFVFWLLTINHAAMRLAAPAFIYALSLLKVVKNEELIVHR